MEKPQRANKEFKLLLTFLLKGLVVTARPSEACTDPSDHIWKTDLGEHRFREEAPITHILRVFLLLRSIVMLHRTAAEEVEQAECVFLQSAPLQCPP